MLSQQQVSYNSVNIVQNISSEHHHLFRRLAVQTATVIDVGLNICVEYSQKYIVMIKT